jgi:phosphoribosylanthranilate isomerase
MRIVIPVLRTKDRSRGQKSMFRIKICGVKRLMDVIASDEAGADAVGFNFFRPSIRFVEKEVASELSNEAALRGLTRVGVFVDEPVESVIEWSDEVGLDLVQLHGSETSDSLAGRPTGTGRNRAASRTLA